jgi:hypothetical protein
VQGERIFVGRFDNEDAATRAYDKAAIEHGLLDKLNFHDYDLPGTPGSLVVVSYIAVLPVVSMMIVD